MDILLEIIFDLALENSVEVAKNKKMKKWIRYPLAFILSLIIVAAIVGLFVAGILFILDNEMFSKIIGIFFIIMDISLTISVVKRIKKKLSEKIVNNQEK